jgi:hypothetical protein
MRTLAITAILAVLGSPAFAQQSGGTCTAFNGVVLGKTQILYVPGCRVYQYVEMPGISGGRADSIARLMEVGGHPGFLANINSQAVLDFLESTVIPGGTSTANIWVGGQRVWGPQPLTWEWTGGVLTGKVFWNNGRSGRCLRRGTLSMRVRDAELVPIRPRVGAYT